MRISAKTGDGLKDLEQILGGIIQTIRAYGQLLSEEYTEQGIAVKAYVPAELFEGLYRD